ncbi:MAG: response regulator, partial [Rhodothermales bacterium]|nr:response regulator [Rhodothermales bacterium]
MPRFLSLKSAADRYMWLGAAFGACFPVLATVIVAIQRGIEVSIPGLYDLHLHDHLLWIINTAPLFLGYFARLAGVRQDWLQLELDRRDTIIDKQTASLRQALDDAHVAVRVKSNFLANMSHEIRTPMNGVLGMAGLLAETPLDEEQQEFVDTIQCSGDILLSVINEILDFSKIEAGSVDLEESPLALATMVEEAIDLIAPKASEKHLELAYDLQNDLPSRYLGDVTRIRQVLINLLSNAAKFTEKGEIIVRVAGAHAANDSGLWNLRIEVTDTGVGIPSDRVESLFDPFTQADASTTRRFGGTGLGLSISMRLMELMGGSISVDSQLGAGSTFTMSLPLVALPEKPAKQRHATLEGSSVLVVDDNATNRLILKKQLGHWDCRTDEAASGADALRILADADPFDVAILDMQMPEMDGLMLARQILQNPRHRKTRLVMLSSLGEREIRNEALALGFSAVLTKPVKPSQLLGSLLETKDEPGTESEDPRVATPENLPRLEVLLAEDNPINQKVALRLLEHLGCSAQAVSNGKEALEACAEQHFDVILMDVRMPVMDGMQAAKTIRDQLGENAPYIIALTADTTMESKDGCANCGMDAFIAKPVRMDELEQALS